MIQDLIQENVVTGESCESTERVGTGWALGNWARSLDQLHHVEDRTGPGHAEALRLEGWELGASLHY